ncbi:hypothetical protein ABEB36_012916 [Hypothenemus hampei]|uniref:Uncharacterized protein n=1 Tax=Hypothenemus hampei TaxID=57062 RepID=A0ABD1E666_HYPHA
MRNISWLRYVKEEPHKLNFSDQNFMVAKGRKTRGRRTSIVSTNQAYLESLPIAVTKQSDLKMCHMAMIPRKYHTFYKNLKADIKVHGELSEPHESEDLESDQ